MRVIRALKHYMQASSWVSAAKRRKRDETVKPAVFPRCIEQHFLSHLCFFATKYKYVLRRAAKLIPKGYRGAYIETDDDEFIEPSTFAFYMSINTRGHYTIDRAVVRWYTMARIVYYTPHV